MIDVETLETRRAASARVGCSEGTIRYREASGLLVPDVEISGQWFYTRKTIDKHFAKYPYRPGRRIHRLA